jgi:DNA polymerase (family 10)
MKNKEVAYMLYEIADILEIQAEKFKPQAYRRAAQNIENLGEAIEDVHRNGKLQDIPGVGKAIASKVGEYLDEGRLEYLEDLREEIPEGVLTLLEIPGLGPKKVSLLYKEVGILNIEELKAACENHALEKIRGLGAKTEANILHGIQLLETSRGRFLLNEAQRNGDTISAYLSAINSVKKIELAGSLRRMKDTVGDLDILVTSEKPEDVMERFISYEDAAEVLMKGDTKSSIRLGDGMQVDLRVVPFDSFGAAMQYFTGSKEHNVKVRKVAISKGLKINEYGVFKKDSNEKVAGGDEKKVYEALGLEFIPPELREDRGEVELAREGKIPKLLKLKDIKGDLHVHTSWSDGVSSMEEMAEASQNLGYSYLAICDHSESLKIAGGLPGKKLLEQVERIHKLNDELNNFHVFSSLECDIKSNGKLDIMPDIADKMDYITASIHSGFNMNEDEMTNRIISAFEHEKVKVFAHPTGRLIQRRDPYNVNLEVLLDSAKENDVIMEINSFPDRLDLNDSNVKYAKEKGMRFAISTDSHNILHLQYMQFGVACARRGWLEKKDVINTQPVNKIKKLLSS